MGLPPDAEALRLRYTVLDNGFSYAKYKHNNIAWLADFKGGHNGIHAELAKYLLGKKVLKLESAMDSGASVPWDVVLRYEFKLRKFAVDMVKDGSTYTQGIRAAITDTETRTLHFTEALKFSRKRGRNTDNDDDDHTNKYRRRGGRKGAGKNAPPNPQPKAPPKAPAGGKSGKGKGKSMFKGGLQVLGKTDDKRMICLKHNDGEPCDGSCGMLHVCRVKGCLKQDCRLVDHPGYDPAQGIVSK